MNRLVSQKIRLTPNPRAGVGRKRLLVRLPRGFDQSLVGRGGHPILCPARRAARSLVGTTPTVAGTRQERRSARAHSSLLPGLDETDPRGETGGGAPDPFQLACTSDQGSGADWPRNAASHERGSLAGAAERWTRGGRAP